MIKSKTIVEVKLNERIYQLTCDSEATLGEVYDALSNITQEILSIMRKQTEKECNEEKCS